MEYTTESDVTRNVGREIRAMQARPLQTRNLYGTRILCGDHGPFSKIQDHLSTHHGLRAIPSDLDCEIVNAAIGEAAGRGWDFICGGGADDAWPSSIAIVGEVTVYTETEWQRAIDAASEYNAYTCDACGRQFSIQDDDDEPDELDYPWTVTLCWDCSDVYWAGDFDSTAWDQFETACRAALT